VDKIVGKLIDICKIDIDEDLAGCILCSLHLAMEVWLWDPKFVTSPTSN
jgi:hypothetical protein